MVFRTQVLTCLISFLEIMKVPLPNRELRAFCAKLFFVLPKKDALGIITTLSLERRKIPPIHITLSSNATCRLQQGDDFLFILYNLMRCLYDLNSSDVQLSYCQNESRQMQT